MKAKISKLRFVIITVLAIIAFAILGMFSLLNKNPQKVYAEETETYTPKVRATYSFSRLNDTECSVAIANKSVAEIANIPSTAVIEDKEYIVTMVGGFASSPRLRRVILPNTIVKISNLAFNNCKLLEQVHLANVQEIGTNAFSRCPNLGSIIFPESVCKTGNTLFRTNSTDVYIRASDVGEGWSETWNNSNNSQKLEFNCKIEEDVILEPEENISTYSSDSSCVRYRVAEGQPFVDDFYSDKDIIIPETKDGKYILDIDDYAFSYCTFENLIIQYSEKSINLGGEVFSGVRGNNVFINREVTFESSECADEEGMSMALFSDCKLNNIILPDNIEVIPESMFANSFIRSIHFNAVNKNIIDYSAYINDNFENSNSEIILSDNINTIKDLAFNYVASSDSEKESIDLLYIPHSVQAIERDILSSSKIDSVLVDYVDRYWYDLGTIHMDWANNLMGDVTFLRYIVTLDNQNGTSTMDVEVKLKEEMPRLSTDIPEKRGYTFEGYYDDKNGNGVRFYDSELNSTHIWDKKEHITLYANMRLIEYNITYNIQGNTLDILGEDYVFVYNVTDEIIFNVQLDDNHFINWDIEKIERGTIGDIEINGYIEAFFNAGVITENKYNDVIVNLPDNNADNLNVMVESNIDRINIIGEADKEYKLSISMYGRSEDFYLKLDNVNMVGSIVMARYEAGTSLLPPDDDDEIKAPEELYSLHLYTEGSCKIVGVAGTLEFINIVGYPGIRCEKLYVYSNGELYIEGGEGGSGNSQHEGMGGNGKDGAVAVNALYIYFVSGDSITFKGGDGGNGGIVRSAGGIVPKGGKGAYAVKENTQIIYVNDFDSTKAKFINGEDGADGKIINDPIVVPIYPWIP